MITNDSIQRIRTVLGDMPIDYNSLVNKPETTKTLVLEKVKAGDFADAKTVAIELQALTKKSENIENVALSSNNVLNHNGITSNTNIIQNIQSINQNITSINSRIDALSSDFENPPASPLIATKIINWNSVSSLSDGWYYSLNSTALNDGSPGNMTDLICYFGEIHSVTINSTKYIRETVYAFQSQQTVLQNSFERISLNGGLDWGEWYETTPAYQTITIDEFQDLLNT